MNILENGTKVRTAKVIQPRDYTKEAQKARLRGVVGTIVGHSTSHGLCYHVSHNVIGGEGTYDQDELEVLEVLDKYEQPTIQHDAYLLVRLDTGGGYPQPRVRDVMITSQREESMTSCHSREVYARIMRVRGDTFADARNKLIAIVRQLGWKWADIWMDDTRDNIVVRGLIAGRVDPDR